MMRQEILFLRHGKAAHAADVPDFERPLKPQGEQQARKIGLWMQSNRAIPDVVLTSPAKRAYDTACTALRAAGIDDGMIRTDPRLYFDTTRNLMAALAACDGAGARLLVVGHNPWMEELVLNLASDRPAHPGGNWFMKTGTLMRFEVPDLKSGLAAGQGQLLDYVLADSLVK